MVTVWVVVPCLTSTTLTGVLAALLVAGVGVVAITGVLFADGAGVAFAPGVEVADGAGVAVAAAGAEDDPLLALPFAGSLLSAVLISFTLGTLRSEERRVGKEC